MDDLLAAGGERITPACAGNRERYKVTHLRYGDHPRLRGEQIRAAILSGRDAGSPPLARGTVVHFRPAIGAVGITPACAGNRN